MRELFIGMSNSRHHSGSVSKAIRAAFSDADAQLVSHGLVYLDHSVTVMSFPDGDDIFVTIVGEQNAT